MHPLTALSRLSILAAMLPLAAMAQLATAPALPGDPTKTVVAPELLLAAHAPELELVPKLHGVIFVADATAASTPAPAGFTGVDVSGVALLRGRAEIPPMVQMFLERPASLPSLQRLALVVRLALQQAGERFVTTHVPPQDLTEGVVRVVVARARLDGELAIEGAKYFSAAQYRAAVPFAAGAELDGGLLSRGLETLNQNPFRRVVAAAESGATPGTTRLALRVEERLPLSLTAGYDNTGTPATGEDRVFAGVTWGNALGRADVATYRFSSDTSFAHLQSHLATYATTLPWRHNLTLLGSWARIESVMPEPFAQEGKSWQLGARYEVPPPAMQNGWTQHLGFSADFKYSDNTIDFATIPIVGNVTHIVQFGANYGVRFRRFGGENAMALSGYASPGGLTRHNRTSAFDGSRPGARADYVYGQLELSHQRALGRGFAWSTRATTQVASGALLGSEQLAGSGAYAVRGYRENTAFGDWGVIVNNELHAPGFALFKGNDSLDLFAFADLASLNLQVDHESTDLRSTGVGVNYQWRRHFTVRAAWGRALKRLDGESDRSRFHVSAALNW